MSVVTVEKYRIFTGDVSSPSASVEVWLDVAEQMMEEQLGRILAYGTYTERMKVWPTRFAYPAAVPIESVAASSEAEYYDSASIYEATADEYTSNSLDWVSRADSYGGMGAHRGTGYEAYYDYGTFTYTGGWTVDTMPARLQLAISKLARAMDPAASTRPDGAQLARVGDVQVSYDKNAISGPLDSFVPGMHAAIQGYFLGRI